MRREIVRIDADAAAGLEPYPIAARQQHFRSRRAEIVQRHEAGTARTTRRVRQ
ncbi:hypothetical protein [Kitasatospora sp. NPDC059327]|uniref:hypothetical protein n=1 Tax=Kitasatospora sp. NPDC059327 TaxID=3346803 RepID=UPI0036904AFF